ncbi:hypothetical protein C8Q75DRAFT_181884 [Abortiporus biennis]|nr:hypothetical protein C8Q75DRAFT_181884 [Abortiporus biennis]
MLSSPLLPSIPSISQQDLPEADVEDSETNSAPGVDEMGLEDRAGISVVVRVHHREEAAIQPTTSFEATNDDSAHSPEYRCADIADPNSHIGSRIITWREASDGNNVTPIPELGPEAALAETRRGGTALEASESPAPSAPATNKDFFNNAIPDVGEVSSLDQETPIFSPSLGDAVRLQDASTVLNGDQIAASSMVSLQDNAETKDTAQDDILMEAQPTTFVEAEFLAEDEDHLLHDKISSSPHNETEPSAFTKAGYLKLQEEVEHLRSSVQVIREELSLLKTMSAYSAELEGLRTRNAEYQALLTVTRTQALSLADTLRSLETQVDKKDD